MNALIPKRFEINPSPMPLTIAMVRALDEAGLFPDDGSRHELIDGIVVMTPPPGSGHFYASGRSNKALLLALMKAQLESQYYVACDAAFEISETHVLGPDIMILRDYGAPRVPEIDDVLILIEIANSSLARDLGDKAQRYASAGIADYWVLDVKGKSVIVHRAPREGAYTSVQAFEARQHVASLLEPGLKVAVADLF